MKCSIISFVLLALLSCKLKDENSLYVTNFNFEAADAYFDLVDIIKKNDTLTNKEWNTYLKVEGNKLYIGENNIPQHINDNLRAIIVDVYSSKSIGDNKDIFYEIRNKYKDNDFVFRNHLTWLKENPKTIIDSMVKRTVAFLPNSKLTNDSLPKIYYHALDHDGSANSKGIFISIMAAYQNNSRRVANFEAHEFHHIQRTSLLDTITVDAEDQGLLWALDTILNEGIADMIDKDVMLSKESDWWLKDQVNEFYVGYANEVIKDLDSLISDESAGKHHSEDEYRNSLLGTVGHIPGYLMAKTITDNGSQQKMIANSDNPLLFFSLYNNIALKNPKKYTSFSKSSTRYLRALQNKYLEIN